jgi:siroheme synthase-like protein
MTSARDEASGGPTSGKGDSSSASGSEPIEPPRSSVRVEVGAPLHPLFLKLESRDVLVVGAGTVAERKIAELVEAKARVRVVAPSASDTVKGLVAARAVRWEARVFEEKDLEGAWLVISATGDPNVQRHVTDVAERHRTFVLAVDDKANASAYGCATLRRGLVTIAISTSGESPALARLIREVLEHALPESDWVDHARALRDRWRSDGTPFESRFSELVKSVKDRLRTQ